MIVEALGVYGVKANFTFHYVVCFSNMFRTPRTQVVVDQWTRPFVTVPLQVTWMEVQISVHTMLSDRLWHVAQAEGTLNGIWDVLPVVFVGSTRVVDQR